MKNKKACFFISNQGFLLYYEPMARFFSPLILFLISFLLLSPSVMAQFKGRWEASGQYKRVANGKITREVCNPMKLTFQPMKENLHILYQFSCKSFDFVDQINLTRKNSLILQQGKTVGKLSLSNGQSHLTVKNVGFENFSGKLSFSASLNHQDKKLDYSDTLVYNNGSIDSFSALMTKKRGK